MNLKPSRSTSLLAALLSGLCLTGAGRAQLFFDAGTANGLNPTGAGAVQWNGSFWQANGLNPVTTPPTAWVDGSSVAFWTGGLNNVNVTGPIKVDSITQSNYAPTSTGGGNTTTNIGGTGVLTIESTFQGGVLNESGADLKFLSGLTINLNPGANEQIWNALSGNIIVDSVITGAAPTGLVKSGAGTLFLNGKNKYTGITQLNEGTTFVGTTTSLGASTLQLGGGTLQYGVGITTDYSLAAPLNVSGGGGINTNGNNITLTRGFVGVGGGTLTKAGNGRLVLNSPTKTYTPAVAGGYEGQIDVQQGTLAIVTRSTLGRDGVTNGVIVRSGATLDLSLVPTAELTNQTTERIELYGRGVDGNGSLVVNSDTNYFTGNLGNLYLKDNVTISKAQSNRLNVNGDAGGFGMTLVGNGHFTTDTFTNMGSVYVKNGQYMNQSANFGSATTYAVVHSGAQMSFYGRTNALNKGVALNGGFLTRTGSNTTVTTGGFLNMTGGLNLNVGNSDIRHSTSQMVFNLNTVNRQVGATLNVQDTASLTGTIENPAMVTTTSANNAGGIIGGYFTYGGNQWAVNNGATAVGGKTNVVVGLTTYDAAYTTNANVDVVAGNQDQSLSPAFTVNTLRFNSGAAPSTLSLNEVGVTTISSGGILVTSNVGANATRIQGGSITGSASGDLIIHQNNGNGAGTMTIASAIVNNGVPPTALTRSGVGTLVLTGANTYSGGTYINGQAGGGTRGVLSVSSISDTTGTSNIGYSTGGNNGLFFNNGTLQFTSTASTPTVTSRNVQLLSGGGAFQVDSSLATLTLSGIISGEALAVAGDEGWFYNQGSITKQGAGTLVINNAGNTYTGATNVNAGTLRIEGSGKLGADYNYLYVNNGGTVLDFNGTSQSFGLVAGNSTTSYIQNGGAGTSTFTFGVGNSSSGADGGLWGSGSGYQGIIRDGSTLNTTGGLVNVVKTGTGLQILTGTNSYGGTTQVNAGTLQVGAGATGVSSGAAKTGNGATTVASGGILAGNGSIGGATTVNTGGLVNVGNNNQTVAQTLTFNKGLVSDGTIAMDVLSHTTGVTGADMIRFAGNGPVALNGNMVVNNQMATPNTWAAYEYVQLIDWNSTSQANRSLGTNFSLDIGTLGLTDATGTFWDSSRLLSMGMISVMADTITGSLVWDAATGTPGAQDGSGTWNAAGNSNWYNPTTTTNSTFTNGGSVVFGSTGTAGTVSVASPGVTVQNMTFVPTSGNYTLAGPGAITLSNNSAIVTNTDATINAVLAGTGVGYTKAGNGILTVGGNNTYTGPTTLFAGTLALANTGGLGKGTTGSVVFNGGALRYGRGIVMDYSSRFAAIGVGGATIDTNGNNQTLASGITGTGNFTKTGNGRLILSADNSTYAGQFIVDQGILALAATASPTAAFGTAANGILVREGATLDLGTGFNVSATGSAERIELSGRGVDGLGALVKNSTSDGTNRPLSGMFLYGNTTLGIGSARLDIGGAANGNSLTKVGSGQSFMNFVDLGNVYAKQGNVGFQSGQRLGTAASSIYINSGGSVDTYATNTDAKGIVLRGGTMTRTGGGGTASQGQVLTFQGGLKLETGNSYLNVQPTATNAGSQLIYALGNINRPAVGATLNIGDTSAQVVGPAGTGTGNPAFATTTTANNSAGILGGYLTYGGNNWAVSSGAGTIGTTTNVITKLATYSTNAFSANANVDVTTSQTATASNVSTLRFNTGAPLTLTLSGANVISNSGILVTSAVAGNAVRIEGAGTLTGSAGPLSELIVHQNNTTGGNSFTIASNIINNGANATALTKTGAGALVLSGSNSYTGGTYISGQFGAGPGTGRGALSVSTIADTGASNIGNSTGGSNGLYFNNGTLQYTGAGPATTGRNVQLLSGGGSIQVDNAAAVVTLNGLITGESLSPDEGWFYNQGSLTKEGAGTLVIGNSGNNYTGATVVNAGTLRVATGAKLGVDYNYLTVNGTGVVDLNGTSQNFGLLSGNTGTIQNAGTGNSVLTVGNGNSSSGADTSTYGSGAGYAGVIRDNAGTGAGTVSLVKNGTGIQILSGASTYTGTTTVNAGILQVGTGTGAGSSASSRTGTGMLTVLSGAALTGNGSTGGSVTVNANGLLSVGNYGQTAAQILNINGGLVNNGVISLDVWSNSAVDQIRFNTDGVVDLNGSLVLNNFNPVTTGWAANESLRVIDWGANSIFNRNVDDLALDYSTLGLVNAAGTRWDTSRLLIDGTIFVADINATTLTWDSNTVETGAQDGPNAVPNSTGATWSTTANNWWTGTANTNYTSAAATNVIFGANSGAAGTVTINNAGGVLVNNITFNPAGSGYYTIAGTAGTAGVLNLTAGAWITTNDLTSSPTDVVNGARISAIIAGTAAANLPALTKAGDGRLILTGANTYTGVTTVAQGILQVGSNTALGSAASGSHTVVNSGASLIIGDGVALTGITEAITLNGQGYMVGTTARGALRNQSQNNAISGAITLASASQITSRRDTLALSGVISGAYALTITGEDPSAIISLQGSGANTNNGGVNINSGILQLAKAINVNAIAAGQTVNVNGTGIMRLGQSNQIADTTTPINFTGAGTFQLYGFSETVSGIQSASATAIIENGNSGNSILNVNNVLDYTYAGLMRGGPSAQLNLVKSGTGKLALTGISSYSGTTTVTGGILEYSGVNGSNTGTGGISVAGGATLRLLNTGAANNTDRLNDTAAISLAAATMDFSHAADANVYSETAGAIEFTGGQNTIATSQAGAGGSSALTFQTMSRVNGATVGFTGTGLGLNAQNQIKFLSMPAIVDHGMLAAWATVGNEFAKYDANFGVTALTAADYEIGGEAVAWTFDKNIKANAGTTLTGSRNINSLNLAQNVASTVSLGANTLRLESGGILVSGAFDSAITSGTLTAGTGSYNKGELIVWQNSAANTLTISANITNNGANAVGFTKSGAGRVVLSGNNTFTGGLALNEGALQLGSATAFAAGNDLTVNNGTFDVNGNSITTGTLAGAPGTNGIVTNTSATAATVTIGSGNKSSVYSGTIQGNLGLTKTGNGTMTLSGANTYTGFTTVESGGTLRIGTKTSLGGGAQTAANGTRIQNGATLDISDVPFTTVAMDEYVYLQGRGVDSVGALYKNSATSWLNGNMSRVILEGNTTIATSGDRLDFSNFNAGPTLTTGFSLTKTGNGQLTINQANTNMANIYVKQGTLLLVDSAGGTANISGDPNKSLTVNSNATYGFWQMAASQAKIINLNGGILSRSGASATGGTLGATFTATGGLSIGVGNSEIRNSNDRMIFALGTINRTKGATINVQDTSASSFVTAGNSVLATSTSPVVNGIVGGYATYGLNTWATVSATTVNGTANMVTGFGANGNGTYANTATSYASATNNVDFLAANAPAANFTINSLRFAVNTTNNMALTGTNVISSGGILVSNSINTGTSATNITGGTLMGSAGGELFIHQNSAGTMTISSTIVDNGTATGLTKVGTGLLILSGANTYSGGTYISGGAGGNSTSTLRVSAISDSAGVGTSNLGYSTVSANNGLYFNRGVLDFTGTTPSTTARNVQLLSGGGEFNISGSGGSLTLTGIVSGETMVGQDANAVNDAADDEGFFAEQGILIKSGVGTLTLGGSGSNTYTGNTTVNAGVLALAKTGGATAINGNIILNGNTSTVLRLEGDEQIKDTATVTLNGTSQMLLNGRTERIGGLVSTTGATVSDGGGGPSTLIIDTVGTKSYSFAGSVSDNLSVRKEGTGTQILAGSNDYTGDTTVNAGTLQIGSGTASTWSGTGAVAIAASARLILNSSSTIFSSRNFSGAGSFTHAGSGTTTIDSGDFGHTGGTNVTGGRLFVNATNRIDRTVTTVGAVSVSGGVLGGYGVINGDTTVSGSGQIQVGDTTYATGLLTINGSLTLGRPENSSMARLVMDIQSGATYQDAALVAALNNGQTATEYFDGLGTPQQTADYIEANYDVNVWDISYSGSGDHDQLFVEGQLTLEAGATIQLNNLGHVFAAGDVFNLGDWTGITMIDANGVGRAWNPSQDMILPELGDPTLTWDTSLFADYGVIFVSVPEPGRAVLLMFGLMTLLGRRRRSRA